MRVERMTELMSRARARMRLAIATLPVVLGACLAIASTGGATPHDEASSRPKGRSSVAHVRETTMSQVLALQRHAHVLAIKRRAALSKRPLSTGTTDALAVQIVRNLALRWATLNGDLHPSQGIVFALTRKAAVNAATNGEDQVESDEPVFFVVLTGKFVGYMASRPSEEAPPPAGVTLTVAFDARTFLMTDWGIAPNVLDTTSLGKGTRLDL